METDRPPALGGNEWRLAVTYGAVQLRREFVGDPDNPDIKPFGWHARWGNTGQVRNVKRQRGDAGMTPRSRNNMRWLFASLPWAMLGDRLAMISLTYPGEWREWVPDGRTWDQHRRSFLERWRRRWGAPMGVWVKEFQASGRPHLHMYLAIPDEVPADEYEGLRQRTMLRHRLERDYGRYEGRSKLPAIGGKYGGDFAMWLRTAWSEVVGTQGVLSRHHARGVDVAVAFWTDDVARTKDRIDVAGYLAGESSKFIQKQPPEGFVGVGRYYGFVGKKQGFTPKVTEYVVDHAVAYELERRLARLIRWHMIAKRRMYGIPDGPTGFDRRRWGNGVSAFKVRGEDVGRLLRWCEAAAERKAARRPEGEVFVWGPTYAGFGPATLAALRGEDPATWNDPTEPREKPCGCDASEVCDACIPPEVMRRWEAGCGCTGRQVCELCMDPEEFDRMVEEMTRDREPPPVSRGKQLRGRGRRSA